MNIANILIVNYHSDRNAGDKVLLTVTLQQLRQRFPQARITVATNDPATFQSDDLCVGSFSTWVKETNPEGDGWRLGGVLALAVWGPMAILAALTFRLGTWRKSRPKSRPWSSGSSHWSLLRAYGEADLIVSCAGNFLYSSGAIGIPFLLAIFSLSYGVLMGKPVYTMPQTIGPLNRAWERRLLTWLLPHLRLILVRDQISLDLVQALCPSDRTACRLAPDIAFAFQGITPDLGRRFLAKFGLPLTADRPLLGITALNWGALDRTFTGQASYEQALAGVADHFIRVRGGRVVLFSQVCGPTPGEDDRIPARRIRDLIPHGPTDVILADEVVAAETLHAAYANMDLFLGTRLHSNIFALAGGVPVLAIAYQYKTFGVMEMLGLQMWTIALAESTAETLIPLLEDLWSQRRAVAAHIHERIAGIQVEINHALDLVVQDIKTS